MIFTHIFAFALALIALPNDVSTNPATCRPGYSSWNGYCAPNCLGNQVRNDYGECACPSTLPRKVGDQCYANCQANETPNGATCVCVPNFERLEGKCVVKCQPGEKRVNGICTKDCGANARLMYGSCVCVTGYQKNANGQCVPRTY